MKQLGYLIMALPFGVFVLCGLIFDTTDFLIAMGVLACVAIPIVIGGYLVERGQR